MKIYEYTKKNLVFVINNNGYVLFEDGIMIEVNHFEYTKRQLPNSFKVIYE